MRINLTKNANKEGIKISILYSGIVTEERGEYELVLPNTLTVLESCDEVQRREILNLVEEFLKNE